MSFNNLFGIHSDGLRAIYAATYGAAYAGFTIQLMKIMAEEGCADIPTPEEREVFHAAAVEIAECAVRNFPFGGHP
jgi:hypothetical protein